MAALVEIAASIANKTGLSFVVSATMDITGGSRWRTFRLDNARTGHPRSVFVKFGQVEHTPVFEAEVDGLAALVQAKSGIHIPAVIACEHDTEHAWLVLEWIDLAPLNAASAARAGIALAALHRNTGHQFGWPRDNFIGATPQVNTQTTDWVNFFQHQRLLFQLHLAAKNRYPTRLIDRGERLVADLPALFRDYTPLASLLHGDTWIGNMAQDAEGQPVTFDPAVYHGDREADVAMCEMFGGYPREFFTEYANAWPLDAGYSTRKHLYNLYHLLNHANLFAGDYVPQSAERIEQLLAEL
ncbi:MAG: fructosamine kinase family protein [Betaproteobacteria bacterium]|nr:fructosamine kinase family protein [Betaproteobacteria bacterium]